MHAGFLAIHRLPEQRHEHPFDPSTDNIGTPLASSKQQHFINPAGVSIVAFTCDEPTIDTPINDMRSTEVQVPNLQAPKCHLPNPPIPKQIQLTDSMPCAVVSNMI